MIAVQKTGEREHGPNFDGRSSGGAVAPASDGRRHRRAQGATVVGHKLRRADRGDYSGDRATILPGWRAIPVASQLACRAGLSQWLARYLDGFFVATHD